MKRQMVSVFLTSMLIFACTPTTRMCQHNIGVGRTAVVTNGDGDQTVVTADENGNIITECGATVSTV